jgi:hypothetical protein
MPPPTDNRFVLALRATGLRQEWRSTFPKDGDPQDAALAQFLADKKRTLSPTDEVIDIGCGNAVLALALMYVFGERPAPRYIAVDKESLLDSVAIPHAIHNNSEKLAYETFISLSGGRQSTKLAVIRNVLHELDIIETADLLSALSNRLQPGTQVFIQDMQDLPEVEPRFAGWDFALLTEALEDLGFEPKEYGLTSHSGNTWFAVVCTVPAMPIQKEQAVRLLKDARRSQAEKLRERLIYLKNHWDDEHLAECSVLSMEYSSLLVQIGAVDDNTTNEVSGLGVTVPLHPAAGMLGVSFERVDDKPVERSGVVGVIFNKDTVDIPAMISGAQREVWFWGYSLAPMFNYEQNIAALREAAQRDVLIRLLLTHPDSLAAQSRAEQPVYSSDHVVKAEIMSTVESAQSFQAQLGEKANQFQLRLCNLIPPCSAFGADGVAVFSIYSPALRGGVAPCFVIAQASEPGLSYYTILKSDFERAFQLGLPAWEQ